MKKKNSLLAGMVSGDRLIRLLRDHDYRQPFVSMRDRTAWEGFKNHPYSAMIAADVMTMAQKLTQQPPVDLSYQLVTDFLRNGKRSYDVPYISRRNRLIFAVVAEALEGNGRYLEEIADGIWRVLGEVSWALPCHQKFSDTDFVPEPGIATVDLFASETAMILTLACEIIDLESYSPALVGWINQDLERRIFIPMEQGAGRYLNGRNNWTPWIASNLTLVILSVLDGKPERQEKLLRPLLEINDVFINYYQDDGACDEGPGYWSASAPCLFFMIHLLNERTGGAYEKAFADDKIRQMGEFLPNVHLGGNYFFNFADCGPIPGVAPGILWLYGKKCRSPRMCATAEVAVWQMVPENGEMQHFVDHRYQDARLMLPLLQELFYLPEKIGRKSLTHPLEIALKDTQIYLFRQTQHGGLLAAVKGGKNLPEGHNHNDCGHFLVWNGDEPVIIDIGSQPYNRETFSDNRYGIWHIGGHGHNAAVVNGIPQHAAGSAETTVVKYISTAECVAVTLELCNVYPQTAAIKSYCRRVALDRIKGTITVDDSFAGSCASRIAITLFSPCMPQKVDDHKLVIGKTGLTFCGISYIDIEPVTLCGTWAPVVYAIRFAVDLPSGVGKWQLLFDQC